MELWVAITLAAALFQTIRTALQKNLKLNLSTNGVTFTRFLYGLPWAIAYIFLLLNLLELSLPASNWVFWIFAFIAAISQIIATSLLIHLFSLKNFMVSTAYTKTEAMQAAIFGLLFFNESLSLMAVLAITVSIIGTLLISISHTSLNLRALIFAIGSRHALIGLLAGAAFAITSLCLRKASLSLPSSSFLLQAGVTLVVVICLQTLLMTVYFVFREKEQLKLIMQQWKKASLVGLTSVIGSGGWYTAYTLANAAYVKTVGQVQMIFTVLVSLFIFKETINRYEYYGMALIVAGVILLLYY